MGSKKHEDLDDVARSLRLSFPLNQTGCRLTKTTSFSLEGCPVPSIFFPLAWQNPIGSNSLSVSYLLNAMVYMASWDEFVDRSVQLFRADPDSTRYVMKYRHCDGKLVLKVTDNKECLKFKTDQAQEAKKMEKLNNLFFTLMSRGPEADLSEVTGKEQTEAQPGKKGRGRKQ
ncbi:signal recognition particle 9 kDa protein [Populus alba x Populus x berolinensis]|nr:signal recognition particle 9 kDa protein [Populus alba x Populus x berolinensis]